MDYRPKKTLDIWLNKNGFYRKHVAMDETCFFRAVSDQLYSTQIYHEEIRKQCIEFAKKNRKLFKSVLKDEDFVEHLDKLQKHFVVCGDIEIQIVSKMLKRDFIIIDANNYTTANTTNNGYDKCVTLCKMKDDHYDSVCLKDFIDDAGFCQALVYKLLYENVFGFENVDDTVQTMLYPPEDPESPKNSNLFDIFFPAQSVPADESKEDISKDEPPFPYKVAKALDPNQYRNIEFDAWNQTRKELRVKDWYLGGNDFKVGTKCLLVADNNTFECYIQELNYRDKDDFCLVYVVEWASKEVVKREELMPIPDAKPWPLPYSITRNSKSGEFLSIASTSGTEVDVAEPRFTNNQRRRKNRRGHGVTSATYYNNNNNAAQQNNNNKNRAPVNCLEGCPLVASQPTQHVDENSNIPHVCKEEQGLDENENYSVQCEPFLMPFDPAYSVPYDNNANSISEEDFSYNGDNVAPQADWNNYQTWVSPAPCCAPAPVSYSAPYVMPSSCMVNLNPPMFVATQHYNSVIREENTDSKVTTVFTKYVEKTYSNNNNSPVPNLNCPESNNYGEYQSQMPPSPAIPNYEYKITPICPGFEPPVVVGPNYQDYELQMMPEPNYREYEMPLGPMMPVPPNSPITPVSPVPMTYYPQPLPPGICPCYQYVNFNPGPMYQPTVVPEVVPQPNMPMLMPNVPDPGKVCPFVPYDCLSPLEPVPYSGGYFFPSEMNVPESGVIPPPVIFYNNNVQSY